MGRAPGRARTVALTLTVLGLAATPAGVLGASHRDAPLTTTDPAVDDTDVFAFVPPDAPRTVAIIGGWIPREDPSAGPNFYSFDPRAHLYTNIDNTGDGVPDIRFRFRFRTRVVDPEMFDYAVPEVTALNDPDQNVQQTYTVTREDLRRGRVVRSRVLRTGLRVAPSYIGPKTYPDYGRLAAQAVYTLPGGGKVFAGQRDDPFFTDLGAIFDGANFRPGTFPGNFGGGRDDNAGFNVHAIALQLPQAQVTRDRRAVAGASAPNAVIGVWDSAERRRLQVTNSRTASGRGPWVQVSRMGNPLVNEVVIPLGKKDRYSRTRPQFDGRNFGRYFERSELARRLNIVVPQLGGNAPVRGRQDIVDFLLRGVRGLNRFPGRTTRADMLRLNLGIPPAAVANRFGFMAGDRAGFPNGRRLDDDIVDIQLRVVLGFYVNQAIAVGDGVLFNDVPTLPRFPYIAPPHSGFDADPKRQEPLTSPDPARP